jgi:hypothetical protein
MYTTTNFKTKKQLKLAVDSWNAYAVNPDLWTLQNAQPSTLAAVIIKKPQPVTYFQPGPFGGNEPRDGQFCCEGPHYPQPHSWYATCIAKNGIIIKVK